MTQAQAHHAAHRLLSEHSTLWKHHAVPPFSTGLTAFSLSEYAGTSQWTALKSKAALLVHTTVQSARQPNDPWIVPRSKAHLQAGQVVVLLLGQAGDDAQSAIDGAEEHGGNLGCIRVRQLHDQGAVPEPVDELAHMVRSQHLRSARRVCRRCLGSLECSRIIACAVAWSVSNKNCHTACSII